MYGPLKYRGIGGANSGLSARAGGVVNAPPTSPQNGSGGAGSLSIGPLNFGPAASEIGDVMTGRITLGMVNLTILAMIAFYVWTRSAQGGG